MHSEDEDFAESSDDEKPWAKEVQKAHKLHKKKERDLEYEEEMKKKEAENESEETSKKDHKFHEIKDNVTFVKPKYMRNRGSKLVKFNYYHIKHIQVLLDVIYKTLQIAFSFKFDFTIKQWTFMRF